MSTCVLGFVGGAHEITDLLTLNHIIFSFIWCYVNRIVKYKTIQFFFLFLLLLIFRTHKIMYRQKSGYRLTWCISQHFNRLQLRSYTSTMCLDVVHICYPHDASTLILARSMNSAQRIKSENILCHFFLLSPRIPMCKFERLKKI